jgi:endonuclease/exonuclease/phosphatase family metal-dependent hydrolase
MLRHFRRKKFPDNHVDFIFSRRSDIRRVSRVEFERRSRQASQVDAILLVE